MDQLFEYHIDQKEISALVIKRSLATFFEQFDANKTYLTSAEIADFTQLSDSKVKGILKEYQRDQFTTYRQMNSLIQQSIYRARTWRTAWMQNIPQLYKEAKIQGAKVPSATDKEYAGSEEELKNRHYRQFLQFISYQEKQLGQPITKGNEAKLIKLCEKQLCLQENQYLGLNDAGELQSEEYQNHLIVLRTLKAFAHSLDSHTSYYSPEEAYNMKIQLEKGLCGIGIVLQEGIDGVMVANIIKGGPASKIGLIQIGDTIIEVDGKSVKDFSFSKVLEVLRGNEGSKIQLGVLRPSPKGNADFLRVELTRSKMTIEDKRVDIAYEHFGDGILGKITLYSFYENDDGISSEKDLRKAIDYLKGQGELKGLVLDLRENNGGFLTQAVKVGGLFISSGVIVISKYSDGTIKFFRSVDGVPYYDGPLVLLISRESASATEIVAQTLQDYGVAVVVGDDKTYGKGSIQHQTVTSDRTNSFFKVTIGKYYTVSGKSTQIHGVKADIVVPTDLYFEKIGEEYSDNPLAPDEIEPAFEDPLTDIDPYSRKWFAKYYMPTLQKKVSFWTQQLPILRLNSDSRLKNDKNYQVFLKYLKDEKEDKEFGQNDLQIIEANNILKDMIFLKSAYADSTENSTVELVR